MTNESVFYRVYTARTDFFAVFIEYLLVYWLLGPGF